MSFARVAASAAILTILSVGCASAKQATASADVNLRKAAGTESEVVTLIPKGSKVEVGKCTNGWCQVTWEGHEGFAIARNLGLGGPKLAKRPRRVVGDEDDYDDPVGYGPGPYGPPPAYYGYGPDYGPYYGGYWGPRWGGRGWGRRW